MNQIDPIVGMPKMRGPIVIDREFLSQRSREITKDEMWNLKLHEHLKTACESAWTPGTGLAAIQVGIPLRFAWHRIIDQAGVKHPAVMLVNPEIIKADDIFSFSGEGCLSMPGRWFQTWRFRKITYLSGLGSDRKPFEVSGFEAVVVQHEVDHMDGILCDCKVRKPESVGRNEPCPCGSKLKFKKCCGAGS